MRIFPQEIRRLERMTNGRVVGTIPGYADVNHLDLLVGRINGAVGDVVPECRREQKDILLHGADCPPQ